MSTRRRADLLRDAARLAVLDVGLADAVQELRLARVDVAHDAADGAPEAVVRPVRFARGLAWAGQE